MTNPEPDRKAPEGYEEFEQQLKVLMKEAPPSEKFKAVGFMTMMLLITNKSASTDAKAEIAFKLGDFLEEAHHHTLLKAIVRGTAQEFIARQDEYSSEQISLVASFLKELDEARLRIPLKKTYEQLQNLCLLLNPETLK